MQGLAQKLLSPLDRFRAPAAERARRLAEAGRYRAAIDLLDSERAEALDPQTLCDLVQWRHRAFDPEAGRVDWPPRMPDPFPEIEGIPEIRGADLTAEILGGSIQHHGGLLVRNMISSEQTKKLVEIATQAFEAAEAVRAGTASDDVLPWYAPFPLGPDDGMGATDRAFGTACGAVWTGDSPRALAHFIAFLKARGVPRMIEAYLGERAFLSLGKSTLRRVPPTTGTSWHQDGAFLGPDIRTVNCWLTLSDCGDDAPGLDIFPRRLNHLAETGTGDAKASWIVGESVVNDMAKTVPVLSPVFKAGDAMLFDQLLLHRTGARPGLTRERFAIESWFFAGSTFPMRQMPIAL